MKTYYWLLWIGLLIWTLVYVTTITTNTTYLEAYFANELDGFSIAIFHVMGYFPLLFILDGFIFHRIKHWNWVLWTAFVLGGFLVFPVYLFGQVRKQTIVQGQRVWILGLAIVFTLLSAYFLWTLFSTIPTTLYFDSLLTDVFIGIMTVDFLVLYGLSIGRSLTFSSRWGWISVVPLLGFSLAYTLELSFPSKR